MAEIMADYLANQLSNLLATWSTTNLRSNNKLVHHLDGRSVG